MPSIVVATAACRQLSLMLPAVPTPTPPLKWESSGSQAMSPAAAITGSAARAVPTSGPACSENSSNATVNRVRAAADSTLARGLGATSTMFREDREHVPIASRDGARSLHPDRERPAQ